MWSSRTSTVPAATCRRSCPPASSPAPRVLCGQGPAPAGATPEAFAAMGLDHVPGPVPSRPRFPAPSTRGCSCCVTTEASRCPRCSSLRSATPATATPCWAPSRTRSRASRTSSGTDWTTSAELWLRDGAVPRAGELFTNPRYAAVLRATRRRRGGGRCRRGCPGRGRATRVGPRLRRRGHRRVPRPRVAPLGRRGAARPGQRGRPGGVLGHLGAAGRPGLARCAGRQDRPVGPGAGPAAGAGDAGRAGPEALDPDTEDGIHAVAECWKLAMADREAWFGDRSPISVDELLAPDYVAARAGLVGPGADLDLRPGSPVAASHASPSTYDAWSPACPRGDRPTSPPASRPSAGTGARLATPATSTSSTAGAT